jgi:hypothetical protein
MNKFLNVKIGVEFYNTVKNHPVFISNWKAISPAFYFLQRISQLNEQNNEKVTFSSTLIMNIFKPYTEGEYRKYITALVDMGLLTIDDWYRVGTNNTTGECKKYFVTELGQHLLLLDNYGYLKSLHNDKKTRRRNQKSISQRGTMQKTYSDYVLNYIHDGLKNFEYDLKTADELLSKSDWSDETKNSVVRSLTNFTEKNFSELKYNKSDGRVYNEFVGMKSDLRQAFSYKKMIRCAVIDIRACHPTFFSSYILYLTETSNILSSNTSNILSKLPSTESLHIVTEKADKFSKMRKFSLYLDKVSDKLEMGDAYVLMCILRQEHEKWIRLFCDTLIDPRDIISRECGYDREQCKDALNKTLNGHQSYKVILQWLESNFPVMMSILSLSDKKQTEPMIGTLYESKIMLDPALYKYTEEMSIKLAYEYDGVSVFALESDNKLPEKLKFVVNYIQHLSEQLCGYKIVVSIKNMS